MDSLPLEFDPEFLVNLVLPNSAGVRQLGAAAGGGGGCGAAEHGAADAGGVPAAR